MASKSKNDKLILIEVFVGIISLCCVVVLAIAIFSPQSSGINLPQLTPTTNILLPDYSLFKDNSYQDAGTYKIIWEILVSPNISRESLNLLLNELYKKAFAKASGVNDRPVVIDIKAFTSAEHATSGMPQWIGWITKNGIDTQPSIFFYESQLIPQNQTPEIKIGLSETERIQIWQDIIRAEDKAEDEALQQYPNMQPFEEFQKLNDELLLRYKTELAQEKGLSLEQIEEIGLEGLTKNWPFPPR